MQRGEGIIIHVMAHPSPLLSSLGALANEAAALAVKMRREGVGFELKADGSIVTPADKAVETFLRQELPDLFPDTTVWGEEFGYEPEGEGGLWLVDPIDGTSNYAFGSPLWGVTVALYRGGQLELGVIALPDLQETYLAERGRGAYLNNQELPPIPAGEIQPFDLVSYGDNLKSMVDGHLPGKMRCSGAFVIDGAFTAKQRFRGLIGYNERLYDVAASVLLGLELGADVRYADGSPFVLSDLVENRKIAKPWVVFPKNSSFILS